MVSCRPTVNRDAASFKKSVFLAVNASWSLLNNISCVYLIRVSLLFLLSKFF
jgi:hypothetical protein